VFKTYEETLHYLYTSLPVFQRDGSSAYKPDLTNTRKLCAYLGNPQTKFKSIHVAGTNGKGSSSHMLASILQSAGYKTGLYTSPHLKDFAERIKVDGKEVSKEFILDFVNRMYAAIESIKPSFFEITVAMAFEYYAHHQVDVAVVEVGLGGRLDSTNIIQPVVSLITNIGWDHMDLLGDTLQKIAGEKAGIIKPSVPVVVSERQPEIENVFVEKAKEVGTTISFAQDTIHVEQHATSNPVSFRVLKDKAVLFDDIILPLQGLYQQKNLAGVLKVVDVLNESGFTIHASNIEAGLINVVTNTNLKGRWQKLGDDPTIICDTGHNVDGIKVVVRQIEMQKYKTLHIILGMVKDKDIRTVLLLLPKKAVYYFCQASIPRALDAEVLKEKANEFNLRGTVIPDVNEAIRIAKGKADKDDFIFIGGSTFVVAEIENL
jgi:dihydrofolate synthase / folylpolyglutamate synthase